MRIIRLQCRELFEQQKNSFQESAFIEADSVILQEIYDVAGREEAEYAGVSSQHLVDALHDIEGQETFFTPDAAATQQLLETTIEADDVVLIMGAGDIYRLAERLAQKES